MRGPVTAALLTLGSDNADRYARFERLVLT
jgi:hypothetical protein